MDNPGLRWRSATQTHRGNRRAHNEDAVLERPRSGVWVVADGMGGHAMGGFAAQQICETLADVELCRSLEQRVDEVEDCLLTVNETLRVHSRLHCQGATVGSTVVTLVADEEVGVALWAGIAGSTVCVPDASSRLPVTTTPPTSYLKVVASVKQRCWPAIPT